MISHQFESAKPQGSDPTKRGSDRRNSRWRFRR